MVKTIVISLGGSIVVPGEIDTGFLRSFRDMISGLVDSGYRFVLIIGGGRTCRNYVNATRSLTEASDTDLDWIGIKATQLNAEMLRVVFGDIAHEKVIPDPHKKISSSKPVIIGAGFEPGCSTDLDAVVIAENFGAHTLINLSNTDYVYSDDPKKNKEARPLKKLSWPDLLKITGEKWTPSMNVPFDPVAAKLAMKNKLKVLFMNGTDLGNLKKAIEGKDFKGTVVE